jgi:CheY-like chemotaxis protein
MAASARILLVDDEEAILFAFGEMLRTPQMVVDVAASLDEARQMLEQHSYQAVVADLRLSGSTNVEGYEVIRMTKRLQPQCKVIVITAYGGDDIKARVFALGADSYLEKPVSPTVVAVLLKTMLVG